MTVAIHSGQAHSYSNLWELTTIAWPTSQSPQGGQDEKVEGD